MQKPQLFLFVVLIFMSAALAQDHAIASLHPTEGYSVYGTVTFTAVDGGVRVVADLTGLTSGEHGIHIHTYGDCSAPDGKSAGGHFNPEKAPHGAPSAAPDQRHAGDLGNITADREGHARMDVIDPQLTLKGPNSIIGRAVVIHAGKDDFSSQPSGAAGPRVACGVIGIAK
ncbi:MAG: superoxide dismutase family protein [Fidelibacterota bacterium]